MKILKFSTSVDKEKDALNLANLLTNYFTLQSVKFVFAENKYILSVKGKNPIPRKIEETLTLFGYRCKLLI